MSAEIKEARNESIDDCISRMGRATNRRPDPQELYKWLDRLRENAPLYFGRTKLSDIAAWMTGFWCGRQGAGFGLSDEEIEFRGFHEFVGEKHGLSSNRGWQSSIDAMNFDDKQSFDEFFNLLDEFRESKAESAGTRSETGG